MLRPTVDYSGRLALLLFGVCVVGCGVSDANIQDARERDDTSPRRMATVATTERAAHIQTLGRIQTPSPELYEKMVVQEARLQEQWIPGYRPIYVKNYFRVAYVEPTSRKLAWRGMTCTHPDCNGQGHEGGPFVFPDVIEGLSVDDDGEISGPVGGSTPRCPACNRTDTVERYSPPDAIVSRAELQVELAEIRAQRDDARKKGLAMQTMTRSPREIMNAITDLPVLYFVEE